MSDRDDKTERFDPNDDSTQAFSDDDATQTWDEEGGATQAMPSDDTTRRIDAPLPVEPTATQRIQPDVVSVTTSPTTEQIVVPRRPDIGPWLIATVVVIALLVGAILGYTQKKPAQDGVVARSLVRPEGGVIRFGKQGIVEIPKDALPSATAITVRKLRNESTIRLGAEGDPRSVTYEKGELFVFSFEPAELDFLRPVKITLPRQGNESAALIDTPEGAKVIPAEEKGDSITIETTTFSFG